MSAHYHKFAFKKTNKNSEKVCLVTLASLWDIIIHKIYIYIYFIYKITPSYCHIFKKRNKTGRSGKAEEIYY
jgi:hypothetical protein